MRAKIVMDFSGNLVLPVNYNHILQAVILNWISDENYAKFIHDRGYNYEKRSYKMYTFSKLYGDCSARDGKITFKNAPVRLYISSVESDFMQYVLETVVINDEVRLGSKYVKVQNVEIYDSEVPNFGKIATLSPITVYKTDTNSRKTICFSPEEPEFSEYVRDNLIRKYIAYYGTEPEDKTFEISPASETKIAILKYKDTVIKAWNGKFTLKGSKELATLANDTGLGSKNSQGFGCFEFVH